MINYEFMEGTIKSFSLVNKLCKQIKSHCEQKHFISGLRRENNTFKIAYLIIRAPTTVTQQLELWIPHKFIIVSYDYKFHTN